MGAKKNSVWEVHKFNQSVIHNFDLSIIMSFYNRCEEFSRILPQNAKYLQRNGIEVIIVMNEPTEKQQVLDLIKQYPFINWKLIVNEQEHTSRNHAPVLNVGIRHATKKYILQIAPEVEYYTDVILQMRELLEYYPGHYALASMAYIPTEMEVSKKNIGFLNFLFYGNIMVERKYMEQINGYDETFLKWGGEDDNIRARLDLIGLKRLVLPEAKTLHREKEYKPEERMIKVNTHTAAELERMFSPVEAIANKTSWGEEFDQVVYNWQNNTYAEELCRNYLEGFVQYEMKDSSVFQKQYKKLILCQAYNENEFMEGFLEDMAKYFDGIILLDDGSTDNTWDLAQHEKILLKVKKKRKCFNDLGNRNILLNLASFFKSEWFCFMDIDERFDQRFVDFGAFEDDPKIDVVGFKGVYLWNNEHTYKGGVPYSDKGILKIFRMFRPLGHTSITTHKKKLHFIACPYFKNILVSKILFKDYGSLKESSRLQKHQMYLKEDKHKDLVSYEYLLDCKSNLHKLSKIDLN